MAYAETGGGNGQRPGPSGGSGTTSRTPAIGGNISLPLSERLRGQENYSCWAFAMKMVLIREGSWAAISTENPSQELSERALATICLSIDPTNYSLVQNAQTARQAWDSLKAAFQENAIYRESGLLRDLTGVKLVECESVEAYVNLLMSTKHKLSEIGFDVNDRWMANILLMGLPKQYEPMVMGLQASGIRLTADTIRAKILQDVKWPDDSSSEVDRAFYGQSGPCKPMKKDGKPDKSSVKCYRCKQLGHYASECQKDSKKKNGPVQSKPAKRSSAFMVQRGKVEPDDEWIFDSGTSSHMCRRQEILENSP